MSALNTFLNWSSRLTISRSKDLASKGRQLIHRCRLCEYSTDRKPEDLSESTKSDVRRQTKGTGGIRRLRTQQKEKTVPEGVKLLDPRERFASSEAFRPDENNNRDDKKYEKFVPIPGKDYKPKAAAMDESSSILVSTGLLKRHRQSSNDDSDEYSSSLMGRKGDMHDGQMTGRQVDRYSKVSSPNKRFDDKKVYDRVKGRGNRFSDSSDSVDSNVHFVNDDRKIYDRVKNRRNRFNDSLDSLDSNVHLVNDDRKVYDRVKNRRNRFSDSRDSLDSNEHLVNDDRKVYDRVKNRRNRFSDSRDSLDSNVHFLDDDKKVYDRVKNRRNRFSDSRDSLDSNEHLVNDDKKVYDRVKNRRNRLSDSWDSLDSNVHFLDDDKKVYDRIKNRGNRFSDSSDSLDSNVHFLDDDRKVYDRVKNKRNRFSDSRDSLDSNVHFVDDDKKVYDRVKNRRNRFSDSRDSLDSSEHFVNDGKKVYDRVKNRRNRFSDSGDSLDSNVHFVNYDEEDRAYITGRGNRFNENCDSLDPHANDGVFQESPFEVNGTDRPQTYKKGIKLSDAEYRRGSRLTRDNTLEDSSPRKGKGYDKTGIRHQNQQQDPYKDSRGRHRYRVQDQLGIEEDDRQLSADDSEDELDENEFINRKKMTSNYRRNQDTREVTFWKSQIDTNRKLPKILQEGREILFGVHPSIMALKGKKRRIHRAFVKRGPNEGIVTKTIIPLVKKKKIEMEMVAGSSLKELSGSRPHQGVCLEVDPLEIPMLDLENFSAFDTSKPELWFLPLQVKDPMNLGGLLRTCYYLGVNKVLLSDKFSCKPTPVVSKASSGAMEIMDLSMIKNLTQLLELCWLWKENGGKVVGTSSHQHHIRPVEAHSYTFTMPTLLIAGSEMKGISEEVLDVCDDLVAISSGHERHLKVDSLNVSVASGIILYNFMINKASLTQRASAMDTGNYEEQKKPVYNEMKPSDDGCHMSTKINTCVKETSSEGVDLNSSEVTETNFSETLTKLSEGVDLNSSEVTETNFSENLTKKSEDVDLNSSEVTESNFSENLTKSSEGVDLNSYEVTETNFSENLTKKSEDVDLNSSEVTESNFSENLTKSSESVDLNSSEVTETI